MAELLGIDNIRTAGERIADHVLRTPTVPSPALSAQLGVPVTLKLELLQRTGSFKARGAFHKLLTLTPAQRAAGVAAVSGGNHARAVADAAGLPPGAVLAGHTDLAQLAALVAAAGHVACGDTGMAHLATALGTPSTVLFGPVPPAEWGPPADRPRHRALWTGRRGDPHATSADPGLLAIGAGDVVRALETARP